MTKKAEINEEIFFCIEKFVIHVKKTKFVWKRDFCVFLFFFFFIFSFNVCKEVIKT